MFSLLKRWIGSSRRPRADLHFVVYTRTNCHLCTRAWDLLTAYQQRRGFALTKTDVDTVPELALRFGDCVPVVLVNGEVRFRGQVNEVLLRRILDAAG
jgi:hypothetical protein